MGGLSGRRLRTVCLALTLSAVVVLLASCGEKFESGPQTPDGGAGSGNCIPTSCEKLGAECGIAPNGCGETVECGTCESGEVCGGAGQNKCGTNPCNPTTCATLGATCGVASDGCGATLNCGKCSAPETCGGGGEPNECGCKRVKECPPGTCGQAPDGCGGVRSCGGCPSGEICGGGGPNKCGIEPCVPLTCAGEGKNCDTISDGCGATLTCGTCASPDSCGGGGVQNVCGCTPDTCGSLGKNCGDVPNGCGSGMNCGTCVSPDGCGNGGVPNVCGCTPTAPCSVTDCGVKGDGCGGTVECPVLCTTGDLCNNETNQCEGCVVGLCDGATTCIVNGPCDGSTNVDIYCPCKPGKKCKLPMGKCF